MSRLSSFAVSLLVLMPVFSVVAAPYAIGPLEVPSKLSKQPVRDLSDIRRTGQLIVLINQSRNSSGELKGKAIGVEAVRLRAFVAYLNRQQEAGQKKITLKLIPKAKDQLLAALARGEGDMVAPGELLTRADGPEIVASRPVVAQVPMILVTGPKGTAYQSLEKLSGHTLNLPLGSAAGPAIVRFNQQLAKRKQAPIKIEWVDASLAVEDVLEMVQAGIYSATIVEQTIAERWAKVMPHLQLESGARLGVDDMRWFFRKGSGSLQASVDGFLKSYRPVNQDVAFNQAYKRLYRVHQPLDAVGRQRLEKVRPTLQRYAKKHQFDWLGLAALAFKESTLNPAARGSSGGIGLMQVNPGAAKRVGVSGIYQLDNNVQASARYLADLRRAYFSSPKLNERERLAFTLAAYNLGPARVEGLRAEAKRRGLNPDQWFFQVERVAMETVGMGVVSYVNSVNKYFLAYSRERKVLE